MKGFVAFMALIILNGCYYRNRTHHYFTNTIVDKQSKINSNLYVETYIIYSSGASGSDVYSQYLTDSANFRVYIGTYDAGNQMLSKTFKGDTIIVSKTESTGSMPEWDPQKIVSTQKYNLKALVKNHDYD